MNFLAELPCVMQQMDPDFFQLFLMHTYRVDGVEGGNGKKEDLVTVDTRLNCMIF